MNQFKKKIKKYYILSIIKYHKQFRLPLTEVMWEQILESVLFKSGVFILSPVNTSHQRGKDIKVFGFNWISCKTTKIEYRKRAQVETCSISSYRLSSSDNYLKIISELEKTFDFDFLSAYREVDGYFIYSLYIIPTKALINVNFFVFNGHKTNTYQNVRLRIVKSLSYQLRVDILNLKQYQKFRVAIVKVAIPLHIEFL